MKAKLLILVTVIGLQVSLVGCRTDLIKAAFEDNQGLDAQTIAAGLKEALQQGTQQGVDALGRADGRSAGLCARDPCFSGKSSWYTTAA